MNTPHNKNSLLIVPFLLMLTALTTSCMELDKSKKQTKRTKIINGTLSMHPSKGTVTYFAQKFHEHWFIDSRLKSSNTDPVMVTLISDQNQSPNVHLVPAKYLYNLNDESTVEFTQASKEKDFDEYQFNLVCIKHESIPGKDFMEQYSNEMDKFYVEPLQVLAQDVEELAAAKLIKNLVTMPVMLPSGEVMMAGFAIQGKKGCSNEQAFVKTMTKEKTKPYGNSMYSLVTQRTANPKKVDHKTMSSIEAQQHLAYHIFLEKNHKSAFAFSNKKPATQACATARKRPKKCFLDSKTIPERAELQLYSQRQIAHDSPHGAECNLF